MRSLTDFLKGLAGVRSRKSRDLVLNGDLLSAEAKADFHKEDGIYGDIIVLGPDAAQAIYDAYLAGQLPMEKGAKPTPSPEAEAYLARREAILFQIAERDRRARAVADPSLLQEKDLLDDILIDQIFMRHHGPGEGAMTLAGIKVTKSLFSYSSNSGKSQGWAVRFSWVGSDGQRGSSGRTPPQAGNRRNDADRNWGLPE